MYYFVMNPGAFQDAVVVQANTFQFKPRQRIAYRHVESRMLVWCTAGRGWVMANGQRCAFEPGHYLALPWNHHITYQPDAEAPFQLAGIHIIPQHRRDHPVLYDVAHRPDDPLAGAAWRQDTAIPSLGDVKQGTLDPGEALAHLAACIVAIFVRGTPEEERARQLAAPLLHELVLAAQQRKVYAPDAPPELDRMMQYVQTNLARPLSLSNLAAFAERSPATVGRMFRQHLHTTPVAWIQQRKIQHACMLLRTRNLSVAEAAAQVGIPDPYYFSKCFRKHTGQSPRDYRRTRHWI